MPSSKIEGMDRQVFLIIDEEEVCIGTVEEVLDLAGLGSDESGPQGNLPFNPELWPALFQTAGTLAYIISDMVCDVDGCDSKTIQVEIR